MRIYRDPADLPKELPKWTARDVTSFCGLTLEGMPEERVMILAIFNARPDPSGRPGKMDVLPTAIGVAQARELAEHLLKMADAVEEFGQGTLPLH